jgi:predicted  nucleic acid-binding Zn-ribbon protein
MTASVIYIIVVISIAIMTVLCIISIHLFRKTIEINPLLEKREQLLSDIQIATDTKEKLKEEIEEKAGVVAAANRTIEKAEDLQQWIDDNGGNIAELTKIIESKKIALESINKAIKEATDTRDQLNSDIVGVRKELDISNQTITDNINRKQELEDKIELATSKLDKIKKEIAELTEALNKLKDEVDKKKKELAGIEQDLKPKKDLEKIIEGLQRKRNEIGEEVSKLTTQQHKLAGNLAGIEALEKDIWADLDRPVPNLILKTNRKKEEESIALSNFAETLKSHNISFPNRTINAFHTGLKAADSSPIVVLSGISGTGKSLLPKLYANYMGMNFTSMAVQPRWDSPQDMLGFYNYMQQRYKATELSRLLWQFDFHNNKECRSTYKSELKLPMNIVLLDEMNIARVEYYFSDMLSNLELRRTINASDKKQRKDAEIEIDCGALKDSINSRSLFVNNNNLFVGTMNEDETTQVLSDKVLDRSNVIRFGKPEKLQAKANTQGFTNKCNFDDALSLELWRNTWCNTSNSKSINSKDLEQKITSINNQLGKVNRPFGHRVWNSIENYIKLYPQGDNSYKDALSDQIEMKILTKLNGLEKDNGAASSVLSEIGDIVDSIKDDKLSNAYHLAKDDNSNAFFQWHGVIR